MVKGRERSFGILLAASNNVFRFFGVLGEILIQFSELRRERVGCLTKIQLEVLTILCFKRRSLIFRFGEFNTLGLIIGLMVAGQGLTCTLFPQFSFRGFLICSKLGSRVLFLIIA